MVTAACGRLGEWLGSGGIGQERQDEHTVLLGHSTGNVDDNYSRVASKPRRVLPS